MPFQKGDRRIWIDEQPYVLRLTMGGLAAISEQLCTPSPRALAVRLRHLSPPDVRVLLSCLLQPALHAAPVVASGLSEQQVLDTLPEICAVFERSFTRG